jgi:hypothetical protein
MMSEQFGREPYLLMEIGSLTYETTQCPQTVLRPQSAPSISSCLGGRPLHPTSSSLSFHLKTILSILELKVPCCDFLIEAAVPEVTPGAVLDVSTFRTFRARLSGSAGRFAPTSSGKTVCRELEDKRFLAISASYHIGIARSW